MSAHSLVSAAILYLEIGAFVALAFSIIVGRIDRAARGAFAFRPLLLPGATLLWPLVLVRSLMALANLHRSAP